MKLKTGDHILHLERRPDSFYRAHCSEPCKWIARNVTMLEAREKHAEHFG